MQVQVRHDAHIHGGQSLIDIITATVEGSLHGHVDRITTVEVHLADENGPKPGGDAIRCTVEARFAGRPPTAVTHKGPNVEVALDEALSKLNRVLEHELGRLRQGEISS